MNLEELGQRSHGELLELLCRQPAELAERNPAIERRDPKIRELEEELAQFRRPTKTPDNSSLPPSRGQKADRAGRRGHKRGQNPVGALRAVAGLSPLQATGTAP